MKPSDKCQSIECCITGRFDDDNDAQPVTMNI